MRRVKSLSSNERGAGAVEFALALPVLVLFIYGIFTIGLVFQANAGLQHALGEAARYATLHPTPSDSQIQTRIASTDFGLGNGTLATPTIVTNSVSGHKTITLTYSQPTNFIFFQGPTVNLTRSKRVYLSV